MIITRYRAVILHSGIANEVCLGRPLISCVVSFLKERKGEAIDYFKRALSIKPDFAEALRNIGVTYFSEGKYKQAVEAFKTCLRLNPTSPETQYVLGVAYLRIGDKRAALVRYGQLKKFNPGLAENLYNEIYRDQVINVAGR